MWQLYYLYFTLLHNKSLHLMSLLHHRLQMILLQIKILNTDLSTDLWKRFSHGLYILSSVHQPILIIIKLQTLESSGDGYWEEVGQRGVV
jgi:hypothetical protein